jgi:ATP-binding protein involved in chromosome partitioning
MDGDIYGPSQGLALGVAPNTRPEIAEQKYFKPIVAHGLQFISMSLVAEQGTAMIWRGPMASKALQQLLGQTLWSDLDYLLVDMPPGTGDIQLTLAQKIPIAGALIVTTPQDLALLDVEKAIQLFDKVSVPIVGLVENMAFYRCPDCGHQAAIFGSGGGEQLASKQQIDYLGAIPLDTRIREHMDQGLATVLAEPQSEITQLYQELARKLAGRLSLRPKASGHSQGIKLRNL